MQGRGISQEGREGGEGGEEEMREGWRGKEGGWEKEKNGRREGRQEGIGPCTCVL